MNTSPCPSKGEEPHNITERGVCGERNRKLRGGSIGRRVCEQRAVGSSQMTKDQCGHLDKSTAKQGGSGVKKQERRSEEQSRVMQVEILRSNNPPTVGPNLAVGRKPVVQPQPKHCGARLCFETVHCTAQARLAQIADGQSTDNCFTHWPAKEGGVGMHGTKER